MWWQAYIASGDPDGGIMHEFYLEGTCRGDNAFAAHEASKKFHVPEKYILCIPKPKES